MPSYSLTLAIDPASLNQIYQANLNVVVGQTVGSGVDVAWLVFRPFQENQVSWNDQAGLYASATPRLPGAILSLLSATGPVESGFSYTFGASGAFGGPGAPPVSPGQYGAVNSYEGVLGPLTFGLTLSAMVNGRPQNSLPVNAVPLAAGGQIALQPSSEVYVWLDATSQPMTVLAGPGRGAAVVDLSLGGEASLVYSPQAGGFVPAS